MENIIQTDYLMMSLAIGAGCVLGQFIWRIILKLFKLNELD